jgi:cytochrome c oxidase cbb3-type subunit 4
MDINTLRSIATLISFVLFIGVIWWAYRGKNAEGFDEAAMLPFALDEFPEAGTATPTGTQQEGSQR